MSGKAIISAIDTILGHQGNVIQYISTDLNQCYIIFAPNT